MPKCPNCGAETQPAWRICLRCEQPLPMGVPCARCGTMRADAGTECPVCAPKKAAGFSISDSLVRTEGDVVGGDKNTGDFRSAGGANVGGGIQVNVGNGGEPSRHLALVMVGVVALVAVCLGLVALLALSRGSEPVVVVSAPAPSPSPSVVPAPSPPSQPVRESRIQDGPGAGEVSVTAYGARALPENGSRAALEEELRQQAREEARRLVADRLAAVLSPDELSDMGETVRTWAQAKLQPLAERVESEGGGLLAVYEGKTSLREFEAYASAKRKSLVPAADRETPVEASFGVLRANGELIRDGDSIVSGERFSIRFSSPRDVYVYVLNEDASGNIQALYPRPDIGQASLVAGGRPVILPGEGHEYVADDNRGRERITLVASLAPLADVEYFVQKFVSGEAQEADRTILAGAVSERGLRVEAREDRDGASRIVETLMGRGGVARQITLEHQ